MVGFGKRMQELQVPEWSTEYLPYKRLKKLLKALVQKVSSEEEAVAAKHASQTRSQLTTQSVRKRDGLIKVSALPLGDQSPGDGSGTGGSETGHTRRAAVNGNGSHRSGDADDEMERGTTGGTNEGEWDKTSEGSSSITFMATSVVGPTTAEGDRVLALEHERRFFRLLDESLARVVAFYSERLEHARHEAAREVSQLTHLRHQADRMLRGEYVDPEDGYHDQDSRVGTSSSDEPIDRDTKKATGDADGGHERRMRGWKSGAFSSSWWPMGGAGASGRSKVLRGDGGGGYGVLFPARGFSSRGDQHAARAASKEKIREDARLLRRAVQETYREINMLESYVSLNMEAFRKIVKKHDKLTGWQTQETYMEGLRNLRIFHDDKVRDLRATMEETYLKIEETMCLADPDRWRRAAARGTNGIAKAIDKKRASRFTPGFYEVRRRRNELLSELRQDARGPGAGNRRSSGPQFVAGLALGAAISLLAMVVTRLTEVCGMPWDESDVKRESLECDAVVAVAPALRAPLLVALHAMLYGVAVQAWKVTRVNHGFIFQAKRGTELQATGAVLAGALAACAWLIVGMVLMSRAVAVSRDAVADLAGASVDASGLRAHHLTEVFAAAAAAFLCMLLIFVAPWPKRLMSSFPKVLKSLQHPPNSTRLFFLNALGRGLAAPMYRVRMMDFFLMDQMVSQPAALRDVLTVALLACGSAMADAVAYAPVIVLLPGWVRLLQVLRRFRDDGNPVHLVNGGKYAAGILAVSMGLCVRYVEGDNHVSRGGVIGGDDATPWRHAYNVTTYAAVLYGMAWDFLQDWSVFSLVRPGEPGGRWSVRVLQRRLMVKHRWKYFAAIAVNAALRNLWIIASVPVGGAIGRVGGEVWTTVYAALEVFRRCLWSYFRVENEHTTNCGMFRATLEVPLPFEDGELTDDEDEHVSSAGGGASRGEKGGKGGEGGKEELSHSHSSDSEVDEACREDLSVLPKERLDCPVVMDVEDAELVGEGVTVEGVHVQLAQGRRESAPAGLIERGIRRMSVEVPIGAMTPARTPDRKEPPLSPLSTQKSFGLEAIVQLLARDDSGDDPAEVTRKNRHSFDEARP